MDFRPRPEAPGARPAPRARGPWRRRRPLAGLCVLGFALLSASPARCDERVLVGGLLDAEFWKTDDGSRLLSTNVGEADPAARLDFRVALLDRPVVNDHYTPEPGRALRPALALGVTPVVGTRLGAYATRGPYLGPEVTPMLLTGDNWKQFGQAVYGIDAQFSRGYFEINADVARSSYEVPGVAQSVRGLAYFIEPKYTWSPRFFTALRLERNDYPFVKPLAPGVWLGTTADFYDVEAGAGYPPGPRAILKIAYRRDRWMVDPSQKS